MRIRRNDMRAMLYNKDRAYIRSSASLIKSHELQVQPLSDLCFDMGFRDCQLFQIDRVG